MVRVVNAKMDSEKTDINTLTYAGYQVFIVQLAVHCFSRPPMNLSSQPMVKSIQTLVAVWEEATR